VADQFNILDTPEFVSLREKAYRPTAAIAETCSRANNFVTNLGATSGRIHLSPIYLPAGKTISSITFVSGATALATGTNQWFGLFDSSRNKLALTGDDTSTAWAASTAKTLNLSAAYTTTSSGLYYVGVMVAATTTPSYLGLNTQVAPVGLLTPILCGQADSGLTNPASCPATLAAPIGLSVFYAYVS
jgi:hypothetical protein